MSDPRQTQDTPFGRWRKRRQAKRQQRLEQLFDGGRASGPHRDSMYRSSSVYTHSGPVGYWAGFGGGGDGGGGGGCDGGGGS